MHNALSFYLIDVAQVGLSQVAFHVHLSYLWSFKLVRSVTSGGVGGKAAFLK